MRICPYCYAFIDDSELSVPHACDESKAKDESFSDGESGAAVTDKLKLIATAPFDTLAEFICHYDPDRGYIIHGVKDRGIEEVTLPEWVCEIKSEAFRHCEKLRRVTLSDSITEIGSYAFYGCLALESVNIPHGVSAIPPSCFEGCISLKEINLHSAVTCIGHNAFSNCRLLSEIDIPRGVAYIPDRAFFGCKSLRKLSLPSSLQSIGSHTLAKCSPRLKVRYNGTREQWRKINKFRIRKPLLARVICKK